MNIMEYRAMKAEQEKQDSQGGAPDAQTQQSTTPPAQTEQTQVDKVSSTPPTQTEPNQVEQDTSKVENQPITVEIDGKEVSLDELKNGYLRQSDYTKKTQEARRLEAQAKQALAVIEQIQSNPEVAQQLSQQLNVPVLDPTQAKFKELEDRYYDLYIQTEMQKLHSQHGDFDEDEVLRFAMNERIENIETAFHALQSRKGVGQQGQTKPIDENALREQLKQELLAELKAQQESQVDTSTIIQATNQTSPIQDTTPQLSQQELKVARMMGMNSEEYAKWRDINKKK